ncbi:hypothetical protein B0T19DRAFT_84455 [Cercophora scortea]|uniref:Uncharacterized protein n=1 Tax=Cercophora scortea TaxID=314031 RepID=A0AAE0MGG3_9PEZI|nr:hypothetical protein B0T19DRAFT_84455 [Cercophora scortea]
MPPASFVHMPRMCRLSRCMICEKMHVFQTSVLDKTPCRAMRLRRQLFAEWMIVTALLQASDRSTWIIETKKGVLSIDALLAIGWASKRPALVSQILHWRNLKCPDAGWPDGWIFDIDSYPTLVHLAVEAYHSWGVVNSDEPERLGTFEIEMKTFKGPIRNIDMVDRFGNPPINMAIHFGALPIACFLLRKGAYPHYNACKFKGDRPLPSLPRVGVSRPLDTVTDAAFIKATYERLRKVEPTRISERINGSAYEIAVAKGYTRLADEMLRLFPLPGVVGSGSRVHPFNLRDGFTYHEWEGYNTVPAEAWKTCTQFCASKYLQCLYE